MNAPSRIMPPRAIPKRPGVLAWLFLISFLAGLALLLSFNLGARWVAGAYAVVTVIAVIFNRRYFKRLKQERTEESICTFARSLPARVHDTWIVRAVFEELSALTHVPIRPMDDLKKDLKIDPEDLDDAASEIARRAGRSMNEVQSNPRFNRVTTVADLIAFFEQQPKQPVAQAREPMSGLRPEAAQR